jgi:predicted nucleotidyltransferase component of viral defense system
MLYRETVSESTFQLLKAILKHPAAQDLSLAGGTSLSLQIGHRISYDLDFFGEFKPIQLKEELLANYNYQEIFSSENILTVLIEGIKVDFINYEYPLLEKLIVIEEGSLFSINDIAAMKLEAIKGRGRKRDFYDLYHLLNSFKLSEMIEFNSRKFKNSNDFLIKKSLTYFEDAEKDPEVVVPESKKSIDWGSVKKRIVNEVKLLS